MFRPRNFFRPLDGFLILLIAAASIWSFRAFRLTEGSQAVIYLANRKFARYDLAGPKLAISIPTRIGDIGLEIGNGSARVASTPCPNGICLRTGPIRFSHSEIVCLPARMRIVLESAPAFGTGDSRGSGKETDAVTY